MFTVCMVEYLYSCYPVLSPGIYKFQLRYAGEVQTLEFLLSVESPPVIKSFQKFPDFVSVRSLKVSSPCEPLLTVRTKVYIVSDD